MRPRLRPQQQNTTTNRDAPLSSGPPKARPRSKRPSPAPPHSPGLFPPDLQPLLEETRAETNNPSFPWKLNSPRPVTETSNLPSTTQSSCISNPIDWSPHQHLHDWATREPRPRLILSLHTRRRAISRHFQRESRRDSLRQSSTTPYTIHTSTGRVHNELVAASENHRACAPCRRRQASCTNPPAAVRASFLLTRLPSAA